MEIKEVLNILLVDDHQMILEGYINTLDKTQKNTYSCFFDTENNCDQAWERIKAKKYHIVFLDINFPIKKQSRFLSGEDLGIQIRKDFPEIKIIISTVLEESIRLHNLLKNIDPEGLLLKGETNSKELVRCFEKVIESPPYYSPKITRRLRSEIKHGPHIDDIDRMILYQLSLGTKTVDLTQYIPASKRTIENRKRRLKEIFGVTEQGDRALLEKARENGYI